jgi:hypothetical protein
MLQGTTLERLPSFFRHITIVYVIILVSAIPVSITASPGECALDFLNIPVGAYRASIGQAGYAHINGPQAIFVNPALAGNRTGGFASYQKLFMDMRSQAAAVALPLGESYSIGAGVHVFDPGEINGYTADNFRTGDIKSGDILMRLGISRAGELSYGLSVSYYSQRLDNQLGKGFGFGFGISRGFSITRLALTADNIGPDFKIGNSSSPLPSRYSLSAWIPLREYFIDLSLDISYRRNIGFVPSAGLEYSPISGFFIRAGSNNDTPLSVGFGLATNKIGIDYSYLPSGLFGDRHIFSLSFYK